MCLYMRQWWLKVASCNIAPWILPAMVGIELSPTIINPSHWGSDADIFFRSCLEKRFQTYHLISTAISWTPGQIYVGPWNLEFSSCVSLSPANFLRQADRCLSKMSQGVPWYCGLLLHLQQLLIGCNMTYAWSSYQSIDSQCIHPCVQNLGPTGPGPGYLVLFSAPERAGASLFLSWWSRILSAEEVRPPPSVLRGSMVFPTPSHMFWKSCSFLKPKLLVTGNLVVLLILLGVGLCYPIGPKRVLNGLFIKTYNQGECGGSFSGLLNVVLPLPDIENLTSFTACFFLYLFNPSSTLEYFYQFIVFPDSCSCLAQPVVCPFLPRRTPDSGRWRLYLTNEIFPPTSVLSFW